MSETRSTPHPVHLDKGTATPADEPATSDTADHDSKSGLRRFWPLGKKKDDGHSGSKTTESTKTAPPAALEALTPATASSPSTNLAPATSAAASQGLFAGPASPGRGGMPASPPRPHSPASSLIFERNVQEDGLGTINSPAIPSHITTENHIPPVLDVATNAITDTDLNPDAVAIITHSAHLPASVTVTGGNGSLTDLGHQSPPSQGLASLAEDTPTFSSSPPFSQSDFASTSQFSNINSSVAPSENNANTNNNNSDIASSSSNYASIDNNDLRRLSFISFADVVHAEHASHDAASIGHGHSSLLPASSIASPTSARSPSPVRSPTSPAFQDTSFAPTSSTTHPASVQQQISAARSSPPLQPQASSPLANNSSSFSATGTISEQSPSRAAFQQHKPAHIIPGSPRMGSTAGYTSPPNTASIVALSPSMSSGAQAGELNVETMSQALRKTGSRDFNAVRLGSISTQGGGLASPLSVGSGVGGVEDEGSRGRGS